MRLSLLPRVGQVPRFQRSAGIVPIGIRSILVCGSALLMALPACHWARAQALEPLAALAMISVRNSRLVAKSKNFRRPAPKGRRCVQSSGDTPDSRSLILGNRPRKNP